jgi:two-component system, NtrC family, response regulator AtoC
MVISYGHSRAVHQRVARAFERENGGVEVVQEFSRLVELLANRKVALVIAGDSEGKLVDGQFIRDISNACADVPFVLWSRNPGCALVVEAMRAGAAHFLAESFTIAELLNSVRGLSGLETAAVTAPGDIADTATVAGWEQRIAPLLEKLRRVDIPLLIQGETGVGKENLARRIHNNSLRAQKIFLKVNCAALPSELVESELFGYERGAFTGAFRNTQGKFETANGGTLLLDEIGDMDLKVQAKLLQVLQDQEFIPLGARHPVKVDVRVMAATHRNLERLVEQGNFREDLYYRLNVINLMIPPLRERLDEVPGLAAHFLEKHCGGDPVLAITDEMLDAMYEYPWPGNLRELENLMRRYHVLRDAEAIVTSLRAKSAQAAVALPPPRPAPGPASGSEAMAQVLPVSPFPAAAAIGAVMPPIPTEAPPPARLNFRDAQPGSALPESSDLSVIDRMHREAEAEVILKALNATLWNRREAAARLDIEYKALLYKMRKLNIGVKAVARAAG